MAASPVLGGRVPCVAVAARVGIWTVDDSGVRRADRSRVALEVDLEQWIEQNPGLLSEGLTVVGRQVHVDGGFIDLLCVDVRGRWVVVELKRDRLYRDAVAQALDYAWSIQTMSSEALQSLVASGSDDLALVEPQYEVSDRDVAIIVAGAGTDPGLERVVGFLARHDVPVRVVSFLPFVTAGGEQLLVREIIEDETERPEAARQSGTRSIDEISRLGSDAAIKMAFDRIVAAAERGGLYVRPYKVGVMVTPPNMRNRYLMYIKPVMGQGLRVHHGVEAFVEFFPALSESEVEERVGTGDAHIYGGAELESHVAELESFLDALPTIST